MNSNPMITASRDADRDASLLPRLQRIPVRMDLHADVSVYGSERGLHGRQASSQVPARQEGNREHRRCHPCDRRQRKVIDGLPESFPEADIDVDSMFYRLVGPCAVWPLEQCGVDRATARREVRGVLNNLLPVNGDLPDKLVGVVNLIGEPSENELGRAIEYILFNRQFRGRSGAD